MYNGDMIVIGVDEAGRGPLAGPVTVGVFCAKEAERKKILKEIFEGNLRDSKKLSPTKRESIFQQFLALKGAGVVDFAVAHSSPQIIDRVGISQAIRSCISRSLKKLHYLSDRTNSVIQNLDVRLDGLLKAPSEYDQKTIIGGDAKDVFIACASIVAKVSRDRLMCRLSKKHPDYGFEIHKGYGTKLHRKLLKEHGLSDLHRVSFCSKIISW